MRRTWVIVAVLVVAVGCSKKESGERKASDQAAPGSAPAPAPTKTAPAGEPALPPGAVKEPAIDACTLVSKADIETATKGKVADPEVAPSHNMSMCTYGDPTGNAPLGRVKLIALNAGSPDAAKSIVDLAAKDPKEKREAVPGLGESASLKNTEYSSTLSILKGKYVLDVSVNLADKSFKRDAAAERTAAIEIAKKAVAKLP